jgi:hypothetical protein
MQVTEISPSKIQVGRVRMAFLNLQNTLGIRERKGFQPCCIQHGVSPVQLAIRLLIPAGSHLLELEEIREVIGPFDEETLVFPWKHCDSRVDALQAQVLKIVQASSDVEGGNDFFDQIWRAVHCALDDFSPTPIFRDHFHVMVPYLTEPWYC